MKVFSRKLTAIVVLLTLLITTLLPATIVVAADKPSFTIESAEGKRGEEVTVKLNLANNPGLRVIAGRIYFDTDKLEFVSAQVNGLKNADARKTATYTEKLGAVTLNASCSGLSVPAMDDNGTIMTVTFKIKDNASGTATLDLKMNDVVQEEDRIEFTEKDGQITINVPTTGITLSDTSVSLENGATKKLTATVQPNDATNKTVTWSSSNNAVATVAQDGTVTAVSKGNAVITAKTSDGKTATCNVTVTQPITGITLNKKTVELEKGKTEKLVATITPQNADGNKTVTWSSSNNAVATVAQDGTVTAVSKGNAVITAKTSNGKTDTCTVTVGVPLKSISFKDGITEKTLNKAEKFTLTVVYNPEDTDGDKTITWSSTDTSVATVNGGVVTAVGGGETIITAKTSNGKTATCKVKVEVPLNSISIKSETSIQYAQTEKLIVTYDPVDTTADKTISWSSDNEDIATVSIDGTVTGKGVGEATITAKTSDEKTATCKVTVLPVELNSISIKEQNVVINKTQTKNLTVVYNPENTTDDKTVTWTSSDDSVVSVNSEGVITALKAGTVTITATVGEKTATTTVKVEVPLESISLNETEKDLNKGDSLQLNVTYNPDDTTADKTVEWSSTDDKVVTVDNNGKVTAKAAGTAYVKAKVEDKEVSCKINVVVPLTGIALNKDTTELLKGKTEKLVVTLSPSDTTYAGKIEWKSSDETVATVDENGNVKALKEGTITITATAVEGENEFTDTCTVTVKEIPLNSITIDMSDFELGLGRTQQLNIICNPENTTDDINVVWSSSDSNIVSVDENGLVKAISEGRATITAKVGDKVATVVVTAKIIPITSISLEGTPSKVLVGSPIDVKVTVNPSDATYTMSDLKFISSNSDVICVNEDGTIVAKGLGKAILTVEAPNGVKSQIEIEVVDSTADIEGEGSSTSTNASNANNSNSPKTGDIAVEIFVSLMVISGLGIAVIVRKKFRK